MSKYDVVIKQVEPLKVLSLRGVVPTPPDQGQLWRELGDYLVKHHIQPSGPCLSLYHDDEYKEKDWDIEVCEPIAGNLPETQRVKVRELAGTAAMACVIHHGPFVTIDHQECVTVGKREQLFIVGPGASTCGRLGGHQNDPIL
jgi:effector-binding domain-containing protein